MRPLRNPARSRGVMRLLTVVALAVLLFPSPAQVSAAPAIASLSRTSGPTGTAVVLVGSIDTNNGAYTVRWSAPNGPVVRAGTAMGTGVSTTFTVPQATRGSHAVFLADTTTGSISPPIAFTVTPDINITPVSGSVGSAVAVTGTGFRANEAGIRIIFDNETIAAGIAANSLGTWSRTLPIPSTAVGVRPVAAYGSFTVPGSVPPVIFTISPKITIIPLSGASGTVVTVTGTGFASLENGIIVTFGGNPVSQGIRADADGRWSTTFVVPPGPGGSFPVDAYGPLTSAPSVPGVTFTVPARASLDPVSGTVGTQVIIAGRSFRAGESGIVVLYDGVPLLSGISASVDGSWSVSFHIAPSAAGSHRISIVGTQVPSSSVPELFFTVQPDMNMGTTSGPVGTTVVITGTGFAASRPVTLTWDGAFLGTSPAPLVTNGAGSFSGTFAAPPSRGGPHTVLVSDGVNFRQAQFTMESTAPVVPAIMGPTAGHRIGFFGGDEVTFTWSAVSDPSGISYDLQIDTRGDFSTPIINKTGLTTTSYTTTAAEALPVGVYYWRVKAVDRAFNESAWATSYFDMGYMPLSTFIAVVALGILIVVAISLLATRPRHPTPSRNGKVPAPGATQDQPPESSSGGVRG